MSISHSKLEQKILVNIWINEACKVLVRELYNMGFITVFSYYQDDQKKEAKVVLKSHAL